MARRDNRNGTRIRAAAGSAVGGMAAQAGFAVIAVTGAVSQTPRQLLRHCVMYSG